jgi:hypothetical protein
MTGRTSTEFVRHSKGIGARGWTDVDLAPNRALALIDLRLRAIQS